MPDVRNLQQRELLSSPGLSRPDLLPEGINAELDELREEHVGLLADRASALAELRELRERFEAEDEARKAALDAQVTGGSATVPEVTPPEERRAASAPIVARIEALNRALTDLGERLLSTVEERREDWLADLGAQASEDERAREAALQVLAEVEAKAVARERVHGWIDRLYGHRGLRGDDVARWTSPRARLIPFADFGAGRGIDPDRLDALKARLNDLTTAEEATHA